MIRFVRVTSIASGKQLEAVGWAKEMVEVIRSITDLTVELAMPVAGNPYRIFWTTQVDSMASFEQVMGKLMMSDAYQKMLLKAAPLFIEGLVHDEVLKTL